jgi:putative colanic acid biosynthesis acetyltransferase WcaF
MQREAEGPPAALGARVSLERFDNSWYSPGRSVAVRVAWMCLNRLVLMTSFPWPSGVKRLLLRVFGAIVGQGVVVKPRVNVKYPWHLTIGNHAWIGEGVWLDSLAPIRIGANACLSQGVMVETGNHDWTKPTFDLFVREVVIGDGAWAAVRSLLLPGATLASHAVLGAGSVLAGATEPYGVYVGVPARRVKDRVLSPEER